MEQIVAWVQTHSIAWAGTAVLATTAAGIILKNAWKIRKAIKIADEVGDLVTAILDASADKKIEPAEVEQIMVAIADLRAALK